MTSPFTLRPSLPALALAGLCGIAQAAPLQLSSGKANAFGPSISADGSRVTNVSTMNLNGANAGGSTQVFMDELAPQAPRDLPEPASLALALVALLALLALLAPGAARVATTVERDRRAARLASRRPDQHRR